MLRGILWMAVGLGVGMVSAKILLPVNLDKKQKKEIVLEKKQEE